ncbi:MAG: hypothetical protein OS112_10625 [Methanoregula sp.]|nr:MAG: hypothetical protein OS112_10625 [Methanoregula sp.]
MLNHEMCRISKLFRNVPFLLLMCVFIAFLLPCVSAAMQLSEGENDLGLIAYTEAPKTWTISLDNFQKVEVGVYNSARAEPSRYGGWMGYLKVNGEKVWEHTGDSNIKDYLMGTTVKESAYRNQYYDLTSKFHKGQNTITYYHYTGDGKHGLKVRLTKGTAATPVQTLTTLSTPTKTPTPAPTTEKPYCTGSTCGVIKSVQFNGVEIKGPLTDQQKDIVDRVNHWLSEVDPVYGSRRVDEIFTLNIVSDNKPPLWSESRDEMQIPLDATDFDIAHEVGHYVTYGIMMANNGDPKYVPLWFRDGLAEQIALQVGASGWPRRDWFFTELERKTTKDEIRASAIKAFEDAREATDSLDPAMGYGSTETFVEFLYNRYGKDDIIIAMVDSSNNDYRKREDLDVVLERRTGKRFSELEEDWLSYLDQKYKIYPAVTPAPVNIPSAGDPISNFFRGLFRWLGGG